MFIPVLKVASDTLDFYNGLSIQFVYYKTEYTVTEGEREQRQPNYPIVRSYYHLVFAQRERQSSLKIQRQKLGRYHWQKKLENFTDASFTSATSNLQMVFGSYNTKFANEQYLVKALGHTLLKQKNNDRGALSQRKLRTVYLGKQYTHQNFICSETQNQCETRKPNTFKCYFTWYILYPFEIGGIPSRVIQ
jgi:hypothetical protein